MITWMKEFIWAPKNAVEKREAIARKVMLGRAGTGLAVTESTAPSRLVWAGSD